MLLLLERVLCLGLSNDLFRPNLSFKPTPISKTLEKILVIQLASIGDVIYTTPVISALREKYPKSYLAFLVEEEASPIVLDNPYLDEIFIFKGAEFYQRTKKGEDFKRIVGDLTNFVLSLKEKGFSLCLNLHTSPRSALLTSLIQANDTSGLTLTDDGSLLIKGNLWMLLKHSLTCSSSLDGLLPWYLGESDLKAAGLNPSSKEQEIFFDRQTEEKANSLLISPGIGEKDLLIGLNPGSNVLARQWFGKNYARLGDLIAKEYEAKILLFGGGRDVGLCQEIEALMENKKTINLAGKTSLKELAVLISRCDHFITNDTGPMHIADAVGTKVIAICGPTRTGPFGGKGHLLLQARLACVNCGPLSRCEKRDCMKAVDPEDVLAALKYQSEEIPPSAFSLQPSDMVNIYTSGNRPPERLFNYHPLVKEETSDSQIADRFLALASLNLWINENARIGLEEEPLTREEIMNFLGRHYQILKLNDPQAGAPSSKLKSDLKAYSQSIDQIISLLREMGESLGKTSVEALKKMGREFREKEKCLKKEIDRLFSFYDFLYPERDLVPLLFIKDRLALYSAKKEASLYLSHFLRYRKS